jgi:hypothetical protein
MSSSWSSLMRMLTIRKERLRTGWNKPSLPVKLLPDIAARHGPNQSEPRGPLNRDALRQKGGDDRFKPREPPLDCKDVPSSARLRRFAARPILAGSGLDAVGNATRKEDADVLGVVPAASERLTGDGRLSVLDGSEPALPRGVFGLPSMGTTARLAPEAAGAGI